MQQIRIVSNIHGKWPIQNIRTDVLQEKLKGVYVGEQHWCETWMQIDYLYAVIYQYL